MPISMTSNMSFDRLIRFVNEDGKKVYGNLESPLPADQIVGLEVQLVTGSLEDGFQKTDRRATVKRVTKIHPRLPNPCVQVERRRLIALLF